MKPSLWWLYFSGLCMGSADIVPGVSGGTMAWICGIYEELITSLSSLNRHTIRLLLSGQWRDFADKMRLRSLMAITAGIVTAMALLGHLIHSLLQDPTSRMYLYSGFLGLILASISFCFRLIEKWSPSVISALLVSALLAFAITQSPIAANGEYKIHLKQVGTTLVTDKQLGAMIAKGIIPLDYPVEGPNGPTTAERVATVRRGLDPWTMLCGSLAASAMLLPGVSGAYLLQILGMYSSVISALADLTGGIRSGTLNMDALLLLGSLLIGIIAGLLLFSRLINWMLQHARSVTIGALSGFMIGALGAVWPFWSHQFIWNPLKLDKGPLLHPLEPFLPSLNDPTTWAALAFTGLGFSLIISLEAIASRLHRKTS